jgi:glycosyltransferase involved in cell wall biosynthesis
VDLYLDYRFMDDEEIAWYMACGDITILYYGRTLSGTSGWSRRAISSKRPIICTDVKLMSDLQDGIHCLKVPSGNIGALSSAIKTLLTDRELGEKLAENAARYAEEISHENTAKKLLQLYEEVYEGCRS